MRNHNLQMDMNMMCMRRMCMFSHVCVFSE